VKLIGFSISNVFFNFVKISKLILGFRLLKERNEGRVVFHHPGMTGM